MGFKKHLLVFVVAVLIFGSEFVYADDSADQPANKEQDKLSACPLSMPSRFGAECEVSLELNPVKTEMDDLYNQAMNRLKTKEAREALQISQKSWFRYMDASCYYEVSQWEAGTGTTAMFMHCEVIYTKQRIEDLKRYLGCKTACPQ